MNVLCEFHLRRNVVGMDLNKKEKKATFVSFLRVLHLCSLIFIFLAGFATKLLAVCHCDFPLPGVLGVHQCFTWEHLPLLDNKFTTDLKEMLSHCTDAQKSTSTQKARDAFSQEQNYF